MIFARSLLAALVLLAVIAIAAPLASAAPAVDGEFALTGKPVHLAQGPDGNIWVAMTDSTSGNDVAKVTPAGAVTEYDLPGVINTNGIVAGPDGNLWATHLGGVFRFSPANPAGGTDVADADISDPRPIVVGPDDNLWTASGANAIRITTAATPVTTPFPVAGMTGHDIAHGGDGNLYIADGSGRVVGLTTAGVPTFYVTGGNLQGVAAGPGNQIAFTDPVNAPEQIGRITPGNPTPLLTDQPNIDPTGIVFGSDGAYWIANFGNSTLSRFTTGGTVTPLTGLSANSGPRYITAGPGNTLWVGLETAMKVARVTGVVAPSSGGGGGGGGGGGTTPDKTPPVLSKLSLAKLLRLGSSTTIRVSVSEPATLTLRFDRVLAGRRAKSGRCVAPTRRLRRAHRCTRFALVGSVTKATGAGIAKIAFDGHVGRRRLGVGAYRLKITAKDAAGNVSVKSVSAHFAIAPKRKPHRTHR